MMVLLAVPLGALCLLIAWTCYRAQCSKQAWVFSLLGISMLGASAIMVYGSHWLWQNL